MVYKGDIITDDGLDCRQCRYLFKIFANLGQFAEGVDVLKTLPLAIQDQAFGINSPVKAGRDVPRLFGEDGQGPLFEQIDQLLFVLRLNYEYTDQHG